MFNSTVVEAMIVDYSARMKDKQLAKVFEQCFPSTLGTT